MTDQEIVASLIRRDPQATARFFFNDCRPLFLSVIRRVFGTQAIDYDEMKLRSFRFESTLYQWLKTTAIRHCLWLKQKARVIDNESQEPPINKGGEHLSIESVQAQIDLECLLQQMRNQRYALVVRLLMIDDLPPEEVAQRLSVTVDNLYNIKRRAMAALTQVALKDKKHDERQS